MVIKNVMGQKKRGGGDVCSVCEGKPCVCHVASTRARMGAKVHRFVQGDIRG